MRGHWHSVQDGSKKAQRHTHHPIVRELPTAGLSANYKWRPFRRVSYFVPAELGPDLLQSRASLKIARIWIRRHASHRKFDVVRHSHLVAARRVVVVAPGAAEIEEMLNNCLELRQQIVVSRFQASHFPGIDRPLVMGLVGLRTHHPMLPPACSLKLPASE